MTKRKSQPKLTAEEAEQLLAAERQARIDAVETGIQKLLAEHNCDMDFQITFSAKRGLLGGMVIIIPLPTPPPIPE